MEADRVGLGSEIGGYDVSRKINDGDQSAAQEEHHGQEAARTAGEDSLFFL